MNQSKSESESKNPAAHEGAEQQTAPQTTLQTTTPRPRDDSWILLTVLGVVLILLAALVTLPWTYEWISKQWPPKEREYLGVVQRVSYVGSFGVDTQIDTEAQTVLLEGTVFIHRGSRMERRERQFDTQICVVGTDVCHVMRGQ